MKQGSLRSSAYAVLTALIWGTAFVAQSVGAEHVPPLAFNAARSVIAFVFLFFVIPFSALFHRLIVISSPSPFNRAFASLLYLYIRIYLL